MAVTRAGACGQEAEERCLEWKEIESKVRPSLAYGKTKSNCRCERSCGCWWRYGQMKLWMLVALWTNEAVDVGGRYGQMTYICCMVKSVVNGRS